MIRHLGLAFVALILALTVPSSLGTVSLVHAAIPHDQNIGVWDYTCRVDQVNTSETITVGADTSGPLGNVSGFAVRLCNAFVNVAATTYNNGYEVFPLTQPRPGIILCSYVYRYGGYWELLRPPYINNTGAAIITARDAENDLVSDNLGEAYGQEDCFGIGGQLDQINEQNGYNRTDNPLAPVETCSACGGGVLVPPNGGFAGALPKPPKARHPARKPIVCVTNPNGQRTCHH